jgi:hypothetical protein
VWVVGKSYLFKSQVVVNQPRTEQNRKLRRHMVNVRLISSDHLAAARAFDFARIAKRLGHN